MSVSSEKFELLADDLETALDEARSGLDRMAKAVGVKFWTTPKVVVGSHTYTHAAWKLSQSCKQSERRPVRGQEDHRGDGEGGEDGAGTIQVVAFVLLVERNESPLEDCSQTLLSEAKCWRKFGTIV